MTFLVHRAERADLLAEGLADLLRTPLPDPFARELVIVPARGVERWLSQRLSHRVGNGGGRGDGVCAGVDFRSPGSLIAEVLGTRDEDPWSPEALMWPLLRVIDDALGEPWAKVLAEHLGHDVPGEEGDLRRGRRLAVARRLARLFASYAVQRPAMLADWEAGGCGDGGGGDLPDDLAWQPELWRRSVAAIDLPSPVVRHAEVVADLRARRLTLDLPARISLFGHTRLSSTEAELLAALGTDREVHLWLPHPSAPLWEALRSQPLTGWRRDDDSHLQVGHPLLAAMGRDIRETESALLTAGAVEAPAPPVLPRPATVLGHLQGDIAADRAPTPCEHQDASVQVHACHGPARQVEVLREVILGLLAEDPTLEPRDILVMCPDIDEYAPLISGAFGLGDAVAGSHPGHQLRVMLADRSAQQTNPLLAVLSQLVDLADGRAEASRVLDLLAAEPVRRRFGFSESDLETMTSWVAESGIRWAWDVEGRQRYGLADFPQNTWRFGLDRILTGVALSDDSGLWLGPTLPLDDVSTTDISLAGRFAEAIDRLAALTAELGGEHDVTHWMDVLAGGVEQLAQVPRDDEWQVAQVRRELAGLGVAAGDRLSLRLADIRALLGSQLAGRPTRANFRTGTLTVCTMTPMRSVPHRVVCLLGLDDGVFPRGGSLDGDDVLARLPRVGERDVRSQDRQLFLDAIMAATDTLVITYTGFSESSGLERPPSVPLREFLDVVEPTSPAFEVRRHRSQAFHPEYLDAANGPAFSFDPDAARAARSAAGTRTPVAALASVVAAPAPAADIDLAELISVIGNPVRGFLRFRLGVDLPREEDEVSDSLPVELGGLARWQVGDRMLAEMIAGRDPADAMQAEWRRGTMPPGRFGWRQTAQLAAAAAPITEMFAASTQGIAAKAYDVDVDLGDGRRLLGTVPDLYDSRLVRATFSRLGARHRLDTWISLVALSASVRGDWVARMIGRSAAGDDPVRATYGVVVEPAAVLADLVAFYDLALQRVLPYAAETSRLAARSATSSRPGWMVQRELGDQWRKDNAGIEMSTAWGHRPSWDEVTAEPGTSGRPLFDELADRVWKHALTAEVE
ncbi:exodeoxyribonuclease V subunit gamma [Nocardioides marmoriginsengisoli]|uniref:RecBCD enzyme subunit RecC n=1 Tax=Nocardioides marmoriginsengisoli TaxID=661483 RepID=A0A3N0CBA7_9ACTN|nr:exodeoxyribonuclease V subunit gamma [Nocardioides marmoriginsengisoli]RNL60599.1 exodeoxyribonuclease V subunit gamma [Nocardioides marmoriginsengisoli]